MEDFCSENVTLTSTSSSSSVVNELIESLLDEVVCIKDCDITAKGRRLSEGLTKERINKSSSSLDPIALIVDNFSSKDILVHLSMRDSHTTILQPFCLDQKVAGTCVYTYAIITNPFVTGYCGHYAIHNMLCMIEVLTSAGQSTIEALQLIKEMKSSGAFWRRYSNNVLECNNNACTLYICICIHDNGIYKGFCLLWVHTLYAVMNLIHQKRNLKTKWFFLFFNTYSHLL